MDRGREGRREGSEGVMGERGGRNRGTEGGGREGGREGGRR